MMVGDDGRARGGEDDEKQTSSAAVFVFLTYNQVWEREQVSVGAVVESLQK